DGATIDELPADVLIGPIVLYDFSSIERGAGIAAEDIRRYEEASGIRATEGSVALIRTDHSRFWSPTESGQAYLKDRPFVKEDAAQYLVDSGIKALGIDVGGPDRLGGSLDVHKLLLAQGVYIIESLCNLDRIRPGDRYFFLAFPLKIRHGTGSPVRAIAVSDEYLAALLGSSAR
ncbi:MAG: cyclase family protein, partial [Bacillota bacterium]